MIHVAKSLLEKLRESASDTILVNPQVLSDKYIPENLLFREKEMEEIGKHFVNFMMQKIPTNLFIWGPTGAGKTHAIQILVRDYNQIATRDALPSKAVYVNVKGKTYFQSIIALLHNLNIDFPQRGLGVAEALQALDKFFNSTRESYIIVFDEIDKMKQSIISKEDPVDSLIYIMSRLDEMASKPDVSLVIISNDNTLLKRLKEPTMSKFRPIPIYFRDYDANELKEILADRIEKAFVPGAVDEPAIALLSALIKREGRDLRWAFRVLLQASTDKKRGDKITEEDIWEARESVERDVLKETLNNLNKHQLMFLWSIALLKSRGIPAMSGYTYHIYKALCEGNDITPHTMRHITHYIGIKLETLGLITAKESYYRNSRGRALEFNVTDEPASILFLTEELLKRKFEINVDQLSVWANTLLDRFT